MPFSRLARKLHRRAGLDVQSCQIVVAELVEYVKEQIRGGESVHVPGLGVIRPTYRGAKRVVCNLPGKNRGKEYLVPLRVTAFLQPCRSFLREEACSVPREAYEEVRCRNERRNPPWLPDVVALG